VFTIQQSAVEFPRMDDVDVALILFLEDESSEEERVRSAENDIFKNRTISESTSALRLYIRYLWLLPVLNLRLPHQMCKYINT
jgi:hypothetical protein